MEVKDHVGQVFSRLRVVRRVPAGRYTKWLCKCDCGNECIVIGSNLRRGNTTSCGCAHSEICRSQIVHGDARGGAVSTEHVIWQQMRERCRNVDGRHYADYGGRGITVCERWDDFNNFLEDMGRRPSEAHTLDRFPDNDGNYEPSNCRWATWVDQARNRRSNRIVNFRGRDMCLAEAADLAGLHYACVHGRLKRGWSVDRALGG